MSAELVPEALATRQACCTGLVGQGLPPPQRLLSSPNISLAAASVSHFLSITACRKANRSASGRLPSPAIIHPVAGLILCVHPGLGA
jgi:hypothetical protein